MIAGAPIANHMDVTAFESISIKEVRAGRSAPMPSNIVLNFGTMKISSPRLIVIASVNTRPGYTRAPIIWPRIFA